MFLALIETQGNQKYIFGTNRQGANIGASQLLHEACTKWVLDACGFSGEFATLKERAKALKEQKPVHEKSRDGIYVVVATSGRAVLLSESEANLKSIINNVTLRALRESPGMSVAGAIVDFDYETLGSMPTALRKASTKLDNNIRAATPIEARFLRLPPIADCAVSTFPAQRREHKGDKKELQSKVVNAQVKARDRAKTRISESAGSSESGQTTATTVDEIGSSWIAVIHADGNGIGKIFSSLAEYLPSENEKYIDGYQALSLELETATEQALLKTMHHVIDSEGVDKDGSDPIVYPIVLGGDDITVVARADIALKFTATYLQEFETGSAEAAKVLKKHAKPGVRKSIDEYFTASAGVAFVKSHYPFFAAYELSEQLLKSAKKTKPEPALDFHVLHDSNGSDLSIIRRRRKTDDGVDLFGGPYLVTPTKSAGTYRMFDELWNLVKILRSSGDTLPRGQIRELRAALTEGLVIAGVRLSNMKYLYPDPENGKLFEQLADLDRAKDKKIRSSWLLDIIDCVDIIQKNLQPTKKPNTKVSVP